MGWFWRLLGCIGGVMIAYYYLTLSLGLLNPLSIFTLQLLTQTTLAEAAAALGHTLQSYARELLIFYLLFILLSYLLAILLSIFTPDHPSRILTAIYLVLTGGLTLVSGIRLAIFCLNHPLDTLVVVVAALLFFMGHFLLVGLGYVFAAVFAPHRGVDVFSESVWRGYLVGLNLVMNFVFARAIYAVLLASVFQNNAPAVALGLALLLAGINFIAIFASTSIGLFSGTFLAAPFQDFIEACLGWFTPLLPMAWIITGLGMFLYYFTWAGHILAAVAPNLTTWLLHWLNASDYPVERLRFNRATATIWVGSGIIGNSTLTTVNHQIDLVRARSSFNMGCFVFLINHTTDNNTPQHETGHGLSLAAFGGMFHLIGALDENVNRQPDDSEAAYAERIAESNVEDPADTKRHVTIWT